MKLQTIIEECERMPTYLTGLEYGISLMVTYHGWKLKDWEIEYDDVGSDYRLFIEILKHEQKK